MTISHPFFIIPGPVFKTETETYDSTNAFFFNFYAPFNEFEPEVCRGTACASDFRLQYYNGQGNVLTQAPRGRN